MRPFADARQTSCPTNTSPQPAAGEPVRPHRAELEFRSLLDAAVDAIIVIDHHGCIEQFSHSAERIFGYAAAEVLGRNVSVLMPTPYRAEHDDYMHRYNQTGEARIIGIGREVRAQRKDGSIFSCELAVGRSQGVEPARYIGFIRDITLRKQADERLRRSESELRLAQELANLGNYVVNLDRSEPDYYSTQLCRILGVRVTEETGSFARLLERWVHPADREQLDEAFRGLAGDEGSFDVEYRVILEDGTTRYLHHIAQVTRDTRGHAGQARRHDPRRHRPAAVRGRGAPAAGAADALRAAVDHGRDGGGPRARDQPAAVGDRHLRAGLPALRPLAAPRRRRRARGARADQRAGVARGRGHPAAAQLRQEPRGQARAGRLQPAARRPAHARRHRRPTAQRPPADRRRGRPADRLRRPDPAAAGRAEPRAQRDRRDGRPARDAARGAAQHAPARPRARSRSWSPTTAPGSRPRRTEHLFNPFFTTKSGGTGLGLAISRSIVRAHGGRLWHTPNEGSGARFHFTLPATPVSRGEQSE